MLKSELEQSLSEATAKITELQASLTAVTVQRDSLQELPGQVMELNGIVMALEDSKDRISEIEMKLRERNRLITKVLIIQGALIILLSIIAIL